MKRQRFLKEEYLDALGLNNFAQSVDTFGTESQNEVTTDLNYRLLSVSYTIESISTRLVAFFSRS